MCTKEAKTISFQSLLAVNRCCSMNDAVNRMSSWPDPDHIDIDPIITYCILIIVYIMFCELVKMSKDNPFYLRKLHF